MTVVQNTVLDPTGAPAAATAVSVRLVAAVAGEAEGFVTADETGILGTYSTVTDESGEWSLDLEPNANIAPENTYYEVSEQQPGRVTAVVSTFRVPDTAGPHWVYDLLVTLSEDLPAPIGLDAHTLNASDPHAAAGYATDADITSVEESIGSHVDNLVGSHAAATIGFTPGALSSTNVQAAIEEVAVESGATHPDLATHDTLGLATQDELDTHAATAHGVGEVAAHEAAVNPHPTYETSAEAQAKVDAAVTALVNGAPGALDTLDELAAAFGDDANFATTVTNALAGKFATAAHTKAVHDALGLSHDSLGDVSADDHHAQAHAVDGSDHTGTLLDAQIPATIARDTEVATAVSDHAAAANPHATYETSAEAQAKVDVHTADASDAHDATAVSFTPAGTIAATTVQAAIEEVASEAGGSHPDLATHDALGLATDSELSAHAADTTTIHGIADTSVLETSTGAQAKVDAHTGDASDAHDASAVSVVPAGAIAATTVQAAIEELDSEKSGTGHAHDAAYVNEGDHTKAAHDALTLSHDSLSDTSANDHHAQAHAIDGADHTGDIGTAFIEDAAVTLAKIVDASATARVLMRKTAGAGDWEEGSGSDLYSAMGIPGPNPAANKLKAMTHRPAGGSAGTVAVSGRTYGLKIMIPHTMSITNIVMHVITVGATLTSGQNLAGLYTVSGDTATKVGETADQSTNWTVLGDRIMALTGGPFAITGGKDVFVYVVFLSVGTTPVSMLKETGAGLYANVGLVVADGFQCASIASSQTVLPATFTLSGMGAASSWVPTFVGIS